MYKRLRMHQKMGSVNNWFFGLCPLRNALALDGTYTEKTDGGWFPE